MELKIYVSLSVYPSVRFQDVWIILQNPYAFQATKCQIYQPSLNRSYNQYTVCRFRYFSANANILVQSKLKALVDDKINVNEALEFTLGFASFFSFSQNIL